MAAWIEILCWASPLLAITFSGFTGAAFGEVNELKEVKDLKDLKEEEVNSFFKKLTSPSSPDSPSSRAPRRSRRAARKSSPAENRDPDRDHAPEADPGEQAHPAPADPLDELDPRRLLHSAEDLFGEVVMRPPGNLPAPRHILAWMAHAYQNRHSLRTPARVVYANLARRNPPPRRLLDDPCACLPAHFLVSLGLAEASPPGGPLWEPEPEEPPEEACDPSLDLPVHGPGSPPARQAWAELLALLREETPRVIFRQWVEQLQLRAFEPAAGRFCLQVGAGMDAAEAAARLGATVQRRLSLVCGREVQVEFVSWEEGWVG
jgi:hypothetical protein